MRDGGAERPLSRTLGVDMDPLVVAGRWANWSICAWVMVVHSLTATSCPTHEATSCKEANTFI